LGIWRQPKNKQWEKEKLRRAQKKAFFHLKCEEVKWRKASERERRIKIYVLVGGTFSGRKSFTSTLMVRDTDWRIFSSSYYVQQKRSRVWGMKSTFVYVHNDDDDDFMYFIRT
jgi:hypothetical protein